MTGIYANSIKDKTGTRQLASDSGSAWNWGSGLPSGSIVQVQYSQTITTASMYPVDANTNYVLQDGSPSTSASTTGILQVNITPKITGSKMWLQVSWFGEMGNAVATNMMWLIYRDTTILRAPEDQDRTRGITGSSLSYYDANADSTPEMVSFQYFDTHGISAGTQITYKLGLIQSVGNLQQITTNRTINDSNSNGYERGVSSICAIELAP